MTGAKKIGKILDSGPERSTKTFRS